LYATTGSPAASDSVSCCAISASAVAGGCPNSRANSVLIPWIASALAGISIPGSISQVCTSSGAQTLRRTSAAVTMRSVATETPVVSVSKPSSGPSAQPSSPRNRSLGPVMTLLWVASSVPTLPPGTDVRSDHAARVFDPSAPLALPT
jgi:hypothetical protein